MRRTIVLALLLPAAACGPSRKEVRNYLARSPHRALAVYPLDRQGGTNDATAQATAALEGRLRDDGFAVTGRGKTGAVYGASTLKGRAYSEPAQAVQLASAWKVQAVLVGEVRGAYERVETTPEQARFDAVPPPACCANMHNPCNSRMAYDDLQRIYVSQCAVRHKKVVLMKGSRDRVAGMTVRLRLVEAGSQKILWEAAYDAPREFGTLSQLADRVADLLVEQLAQAYMKQLL